MFRPEEMAMILEQAKQYTDSQRLGHIVSSAKTLTYDGDITGKVLINGYVRISDSSMDLSPLTKITLSIHPDMVEDFGSDFVEYTDLIVVGTTDGQVAFSEGMNLVCSIEKPNETFTEQGLYVLCEAIDENILGAWISKLEFKEVIKQIPAEYIPPLDALYLNGTDGKRYKLFVDESGQLVTTEVTT